MSFGKFSKFFDFWPENGHLARTLRRKIVTFFVDGKCNRAFKNAQNWLKISILLVYNALKSYTSRIFDILSFCDFMRPHKHQGGRFLGKNR